MTQEDVAKLRNLGVPADKIVVVCDRCLWTCRGESHAGLSTAMSHNSRCPGETRVYVRLDYVNTIV